MVMTKQPEGIRRVKRKTEVIAGKEVVTEYDILGEAPVYEPGTVLGFTRRVQKKSVSAWEAHPAKGRVTEHKNHTEAVLALIQAHKEAGVMKPAVTEAVGPEHASADVPAPRRARKPARPRKARQKSADPEAEAERLLAEETAREQLVSAADPTVPAAKAPTGPSVSGSSEADLEQAVTEDPDLAAAVADPEAWGTGYPEGQPPLPDPFAEPEDSPFDLKSTGFIR